MAPVCEFLFDFGSPNAYLAWKMLPALEARTGVHFRPVPILLGGVFKATGNASPAVAFANVPAKLQYEMLEMRRFIARHGLDAFQFNPHFPVNTLLLMRMAVAADRAGTLPAFMAATFHHMWEAPKKMDDPEIVVTALNDSGLDGMALATAAQDPDVKAGLIANTEGAVKRGVFGAPSFFVADALYFGKDRLRDIEDEIVAQSG
ncbi:MAG: 2-hydroxychromene-2-carboxylate isomerase [Alphaproteobacteria bacterium]|nr:MAG: 2-hydroxychromene-2-carboxylate isomerase [Alphaproteobacteria bacterium]